MRRFMLLPLLALAACGAGNDMPPASPDAREYATQMIAPSPDYAAMIAAAESPVDHSELRREASEEPPADAKAIGDIWLARLQERGVVDGYGLAGKDDDSPIAGFDLVMTPQDFDAWVEENGWDMPLHLRWSFVAPLSAPRVSTAAEEQIRIWPASEQRTGLQLQAADGGRIFLQDGCFFVERRGDDVPKLAWFHTETGLDVDEEGYFVLVNRIDGQVAGRLGEEFTWASPNPILPGGPAEEEMRDACGDAEIFGVANPTANARMDTLYPPQRAPDAMPPPGIE